MADTAPQPDSSPKTRVQLLRKPSRSFPRAFSRTFLSAFFLLAAMWLGAASFGPVALSVVSTAQAASSPAVPDTGVDSTQLKQLLGVLDDPSKRQQFVSTLKTLANVQAKAEKNADEGLIDQAWGHVTTFGQRLLKQSQALTQTITNFHAFLPWLHHVLRTPALQNEIGRICLRVAIMIVGGLALSYGMAFLLSKPRHKLIEMAQKLHENELKAAAEAKRRAEEEAKAKEEAEEKAKAEKEEKEKEEAAAKLKAEAEAKVKAEAETQARLQAEADAEAKAKEEAAEKAKADKEEKEAAKHPAKAAPKHPEKHADPVKASDDKVSGGKAPEGKASEVEASKTPTPTPAPPAAASAPTKDSSSDEPTSDGTTTQIKPSLTDPNQLDASQAHAEHVAAEAAAEQAAQTNAGSNTSTGTGAQTAALKTPVLKTTAPASKTAPASTPDAQGTAGQETSASGTTRPASSATTAETTATTSTPTTGNDESSSGDSSSDDASSEGTTTQIKPSLSDPNQLDASQAHAENAEKAQQNQAASQSSAPSPAQPPAQTPSAVDVAQAEEAIENEGQPLSLEQTAIAQYDLSETLPTSSNVTGDVKTAAANAVAATVTANLDTGRPMTPVSAPASSEDAASAEQNEAGGHAADQASDGQASENRHGENGGDESSSSQAPAVQPESWQGSMMRLMASLRRVPYTLGLFCLNLVSIMMFPVMALIIQNFDPSPDKQTLQAVWSISWLASVALGTWVAFLRVLFAPLHPCMRLIPCTDQTAWFFFRGLKRIGTISSWGITALIILKGCTLPANVLESLAKLLMLIVHIMVAVMIIGARPAVHRACARAIAHKSGLGTILRLASRTWWIAALFFDMGLWLVWAMDIQGGYQMMLALFVRTCVTLLIMRVVSIVALSGLERLFNTLESSPHLSELTQSRISRYMPIAEKIADVLLMVLTVLALGVAWGLPIKVLIGAHSFGAELFSSFMTIAIAFLVGVTIWEAANVFVERRIHRLTEETGGGREVKVRIARLRTLQPMMRILLLVSLTIIIGLTVLSQLGVNTAPLLAGASIFGVALGFGAQKLVQDFISGIFLLLENALTVGDAVTLNGTYGIVEKLSLRTVHVRGNDGSMNIFPFSSLGQTINYNREFGRALIVADVAYDSNIGDVIKALHDITASMRADPDYADLIIDDFQLWGVDSLNDSSVTVKGTLPTIPTGRWPVQRQFNRRMLVVFGERGIDFPFPTRTLDMPGLDHILEQRTDFAAPSPAEGGNAGASASGKNASKKGRA